MNSKAEPLLKIALSLILIHLTSGRFAWAEPNAVNPVEDLIPVTAASKSSSMLTWAEVLNLGLRENPMLQSAAADLSAADASESSILWKYGPSLSAQGRWNQSSTNNASATQDYATTLGLNQNIFNYANWGSLSEARARKKASTAALTLAQLELLKNLKIAYATVVFSKQDQRSAESILRRRKQNADLVSLRYEGGKENKGALLLSKANLEDAQNAVLKSQEDARAAFSNLAVMIGLSPDHELVLADDLPLKNAPAQVNYEQILNESPERFQSMANEEASLAAIQTAQGRRLPTLDFAANIGRYGDRLWPQTDGWSTAMTLTVPFSISNHYDVQVARALAQAASMNRKSLETNLRVRLEKANNLFRSAERQALSAKNFLTAAQSRAEIARRKYEIGILSFDEWDRIESDLILRENTILRANLDLISAEASWENLTATGVTP